MRYSVIGHSSKLKICRHPLVSYKIELGVKIIKTEVRVGTDIHNHKYTNERPSKRAKLMRRVLHNAFGTALENLVKPSMWLECFVMPFMHTTAVGSTNCRFPRIVYDSQFVFLRKIMKLFCNSFFSCEWLILYLFEWYRFGAVRNRYFAIYVSIRYLSDTKEGNQKSNKVVK